MVHHVRSKTVIGIINRLSLVLGLASLCSWIYFNVHSDIWCQSVHLNPLLMYGLLLLAVSLVRYITTWFFSFRLKYKNLVTYMYCFSMFMLIIIILVGTGIVLIVTHNSKAKEIPRRANKEYVNTWRPKYVNTRRPKYVNTKQYSWLQRYLEDPLIRDKIRTCLIDSQVCTKFGNQLKNQNASEIYKKELPPIQSSCCLPPKNCHLEHKKANLWVMPGSDNAIFENSTYKGRPFQFKDCNRWRNDQEKLCYNCNLCTDGILANMRMEWRHLAVINICVLVFVIIVHSIHWCITRNIELDSKYSGYREYP